MSTHQYILPHAQPVTILEGARLLYVTRAQYSAEWTSAPHIHTCAELFFVLGGSGSLQMQQTDVPVLPGDLVVVSAGVPHTEHSQEAEPLEYVVLGVEGLETLTAPEGYAVVHDFSTQQEVAACLELLLQEAAGGEQSYDAVCQSIFRILLLFLAREGQSMLLPVPRSPKASRECSLVRRYIENHFKENITLDQLAALAHLNKYYLSHAFQKEYGVSPIRYLTRRRIQESRFLLAETDHSLSHIAQVLGFSSLSYFSQCFRRLEGLSPKEYRLRCRGES